MLEELINVNDFDYNIINNYQVIKSRRRKKENRKNYINVICTFDIESTRLVEIEQSIMYIWQLQYDDITVVGRTWEEFIYFLKRISDMLEEQTYLVIYVHNLSYEFSFLKGIYSFNENEVFCTDRRKVLKCEMYNHIEFRCSYFLTNMSLEKLLKKYDVENKKTKYDYNKLRYPWTELSDEELIYCINDVKGLSQALKKQFMIDNHNLQTVPLTSTGYVRVDVKEAMKQFNHKELYNMLPSVNVYKLEREAFRGGDTLSNRWCTDTIIENVKKVDIVSSYPTSMLLDMYPMTRFILEDTKDFEEIYKRGTKAMLFRCTFYNINVKTIFEGHLYLAMAKCRDIIKGTFANGRVVCADRLTTTLTDIDYEIITRRYQWEYMEVEILYTSHYRMLPSFLRDVILNYYRIKTELKGSKEGTDDYYYYAKSKEKLNSSYGMTVQDIGKPEIQYINGEFTFKETNLNELISKSNKRAFLNYAWGIWTTAHSRKRLADGIDVVTKNGTEPSNFIYSDTDSIVYTGAATFDEYNKNIIEQAKRQNAYAVDKHGEVHYVGVYEDEGYDKKNRFKTLGSKKYVYEDSNKKLHITIAGVNKATGGEELGRIENFEEGFIFVKSGGTESVFNDNIDMYYDIEGHQLHITDNVVIRDSTYTLGVTAEYRAILNGLANIKYSEEDMKGLFKVIN